MLALGFTVVKATPKIWNLFRRVLKTLNVEPLRILGKESGLVISVANLKGSDDLQYIIIGNVHGSNQGLMNACSFHAFHHLTRPDVRAKILLKSGTNITLA